jgi:hypothetical protein
MFLNMLHYSHFLVNLNPTKNPRSKNIFYVQIQVLSSEFQLNSRLRNQNPCFHISVEFKYQRKFYADL